MLPDVEAPQREGGQVTCEQFLLMYDQDPWEFTRGERSAWMSHSYEKLLWYEWPDIKFSMPVDGGYLIPASMTMLESEAYPSHVARFNLPS